jgi:hypothetical protein
MPPIILVLLQGLFLLLLYLFLARAVRAVIRDVRMSAAPPRPARGRATARPASARVAASAGGRRPTRRQPNELVVHSPGTAPRVVPLDSTEVRLGRSDECTVTLQDTYVSEQHARFYLDGSEWLVADMGSTNGTYLNRSKLTGPTPIQPGDQVAIGKTVVEVRK